MADAISVLRHVVGLPSVTPNWLLFDASDPTVPGVALLAPGTVPSLRAEPTNASPGQLSLVGVLRGDVDGSFGGRPGAKDLDQIQPDFFELLVQNTGFDPSQFGIYNS